jgi:hypothetical protein
MEDQVVQKIRVELFCDVCDEEEPAERTQSFSFDDGSGRRREYRIELCSRHLKEFGEGLLPWVEKSRIETSTKQGPPRRPSGSTAPTDNHRGPARRDAEQLAAIRSWARDNGFEVSDRGRIPAQIEEAYNRRSGG